MLRQYLATLRKYGDSEGITLCLRRLGEVRQRVGDIEGALAHFRQALTSAPLENEGERALLLLLIGDLSLERNPTGVVEVLQEAYALFSKLQRRFEMGLAAARLALVCEAPAKLGLLAEAVEIFAAEGYVAPAVDALCALASFHLARGEDAPVAVCVDHAKQLLALPDDPTPYALNYLNLGRLCTEVGEYDEARSALRTAAKAFRSQNNAHGEAAGARALGQLYRAQGANDAALREFRRAITALYEQRDEPAVVQVALELAETHCALGEIHAATNHLERVREYASHQPAATKATLLGELARIVGHYFPEPLREKWLVRLEAPK